MYDQDSLSSLEEETKSVVSMDLTEFPSSTATSYNNTGLMLYASGDLDGALKMYKQCLAVQEKMMLVESGSTRSLSSSSSTASSTALAMTYNNIGMVMEDKGDFDGALKMYENCLKIEEKVLGRDHHSTVVTCRNIESVKSKKQYLSY